MPLNSDIKFQKTLALYASASTPAEAEAAELAARRLMDQHKIDPIGIPVSSLYDGSDFSDNALLKKLCEERPRKEKPTEEIDRGENKNNTGTPYGAITFNPKKISGRPKGYIARESAFKSRMEDALRKAPSENLERWYNKALNGEYTWRIACTKVGLRVRKRKDRAELTLVDDAYAILKARVDAGGTLPGKDQLSRETGFSRTVIEKATYRLKSEIRAVDEEFWAPFKARAAAEGKTPKQKLTELVREYLGDDPDQCPPT